MQAHSIRREIQQACVFLRNRLKQLDMKAVY